MRDLAFSEPKAFLAWFMLQSIPAGPYPGLPPPPPQATAGAFVCLVSPGGAWHSWN